MWLHLSDSAGDTVYPCHGTEHRHLLGVGGSEDAVDVLAFSLLR